MEVASGINLQEGGDMAVKPLVVRPGQRRERAEIPGRNGHFRKRGAGGDRPLLDRHLLDELAEVTRLKTTRSVTVLRDLSPGQFQQHLRRANETGRRYIVNFS